MSDPERLVDASADELERTLLQSWQTEQPSREARNRALGLVGAGAATSVAAGAAHAAAGAPHATLGLAVVKWLGIGAALGLVASGVALHLSNPVPRALPVAVWRATPRAAATPARVATAAADTSPPIAPEDLPTAAPSRGLAEHGAPELDAGATLATADAPHGSLGPETAALDRARAALRSGDAARCLALVADYQQRFPGGMLAQEAQVLRIDALERQGLRREAAREAQRFVTAHEDSPHAEQLRALAGDAGEP